MIHILKIIPNCEHKIEIYVFLLCSAQVKLDYYIINFSINLLVIF